LRKLIWCIGRLGNDGENGNRMAAASFAPLQPCCDGSCGRAGISGKRDSFWSIPMPASARVPARRTIRHSKAQKVRSWRRPSFPFSPSFTQAAACTRSACAEQAASEQCLENYYKLKAALEEICELISNCCGPTSGMRKRAGNDSSPPLGQRQLRRRSD